MIQKQQKIMACVMAERCDGMNSNLKVGCGKFIYGKGCLKEMISEILHFGKRPLLIGGVTSLKKVLDGISMENHGIQACVFEHTGSCSKKWALKYGEIAKEKNCSVIVAVGGGKCIDLGKCTSAYSGLPIITIPTSIATCAATSAVCIMYDEEGRSDGSVAMEREVDVCIADSNIILNAPKRLLAAGIFDSLAKLPEVLHNTKIADYRDCPLNQYISMRNSSVIYEFLSQEGPKAYWEGEDYKTFDEMIIANLILTSVVSGFSSGSGQLALAHGLYDFMRRNFPRESAGSLHGEIVAVGVLMQFAFNGETSEHVDKYRKLMKEMGVPVSLSQVGFENTMENRKLLIDYLMANASNGKEMDLEKLKKAMTVIL